MWETGPASSPWGPGAPPTVAGARRYSPPASTPDAPSATALWDMPANGASTQPAGEGYAPASPARPDTPVASSTSSSFAVQLPERQDENEVVEQEVFAPVRAAGAPAPVSATTNGTTANGTARAPLGDPAPVPAAPPPVTERDDETSAEYREVAHASTAPQTGSHHPAPTAAPTPPPAPVRGVSARSPRELLERSLAALEPVSDAEAGPFAARFAADYLSFDQDDPALRAEVLRGYLADPAAALLGWSGQGRQRCEFVLPGRTLHTDDGVVVVEVTARVVTYDRSPEVAGGPETGVGAAPPGPSSAIGRSCAPAPTGRGWIAGGAHWVQLAPPVRRHRTGRLVIDFGARPAVEGGRP